METDLISGEIPAGPLRLPAVLDVAAAAPLTHAILDRRGAALKIDASDVRRIGGLCLQVLFSAQRQWGEDREGFAIGPTSDAFDDALALFGAETLRAPTAASPDATEPFQ